MKTLKNKLIPNFLKEYIIYYNKFYSIKRFEKFESFDLKLSLLKNYHFK